jgi:hypothetical protein
VVHGSGLGVHFGSGGGSGGVLVDTARVWAQNLLEVVFIAVTSECR